MIPLLRKELEELLPLTLGILLGAVIWIAAHMTQPLPTWSVHASLEYLIEDWAFFTCLAAFVAGHSRVGPEFLLGTVAFLEGLPISRPRMYLVKTVAGSVPVLLMVVLTAVVKGWALSAWPGTSGNEVTIVVLWTTLHVALLLYAFFGAGLFLSWFGTLGWAALGTFAGGMLILTLISPSLRSWFPLLWGVVDLVWIDGRPQTQVAPLFAWFVVGSGGIAVSGALFLGPGERLVQAGSAVAALVRIAVFAVPGCGLTLLGALSGVGLLFSIPSFFAPTFRASTPHFRFLGQQASRTEVMAVVAEAERLREEIAAIYDHPGPARVDVEMTGSAEHYAGLALRGKIKTAPKADFGVLAHELSHSFSQEIQGVVDQGESWRFFEEGLATWVEGQVGAPLVLPTTAAGSWRSGQADWMMLFEDTRRRKVFDPDQAYPLGSVWALSIAETTGASPTCLVHASVGVDPSLDGVPRWSQMLEQCGTTLAEVVDAYERHLVVPASPLPTGAALIERKGGTIEVAVSGEGVTHCRVRDSWRDDRELYDIYTADRGVCSIWRGNISRSRFDLQLGISVVAGDPPIWLQWHRVTVPP